MKDVFLADFGGFWYLFDRTVVQRVMAMETAPKPTVGQGQSWLDTEEGNVEICPLNLVFKRPANERGNNHYLVLSHNGRLLALPMRGKGRECMALLHALRPLPPAFPELSRQLVTGLLLNGLDVVMRLDVDELVKVMDKITYLRKKKLESRQQAGA